MAALAPRSCCAYIDEPLVHVGTESAVAVLSFSTITFRGPSDTFRRPSATGSPMARSGLSPTLQRAPGTANGPAGPPTTMAELIATKPFGCAAPASRRSSVIVSRLLRAAQFGPSLAVIRGSRRFPPSMTSK